MEGNVSNNKKVVIVYWKNREHEPSEVFSSLKNFCLRYKEYNYNTLSNYFKNAKSAYENEDVRIERKSIIAIPKTNNVIEGRHILPVVRKVPIKEADDTSRDLDYWLNQPVVQRLAAVTFLVCQFLNEGERMDKSRVVKKKMKK